jgi:hypothetical protein
MATTNQGLWLMFWSGLGILRGRVEDVSGFVRTLKGIVEVPAGGEHRFCNFTGGTGCLTP